VSFLDAGLAMSLRSRKPVFAIDAGIAKHWWVKPFSQAHSCSAARSDEADGGAHADRGGQGRQRPDHLPGRAHHCDRQPDEGL